VRPKPRHVLLGVVALLLAACGQATAGPAGVGAGDAAVVDGTSIPRSELADYVDGVLELELALADEIGADLTPEGRRDLVEQLQVDQLNRLINRELLFAVAADLDIDPADIDAEASSIRGEISEQLGGEEELERLLRQDGLTLELVDDVLLPQDAALTLIRRELVGESVATRTVRHILVEDEDEADAIVAELADGADFAALAEERSIDPGSGARGGDLGPALRGAYVPPFDDAVWESELDEVVGPVASDFGFHVLEVTAEDQTPADEVPPQQLDQISGAELEERLAPISAAIEVDPAFGRWDATSRQLVPAERVGEGSPAPLAPSGDEPLDEAP
jgi:parvulin-like peptidyl-prolyl isomerase